MQSPWPAAHSMDTTWFAVDADGHVGVFETGENGALPTEAATIEDHTYEFLDDDDAGTFHYFNDDDVPGSYARDPNARTAIKLSELAPDTQERVAKLRLPIRFSEVESIQLADFLKDEDCQTWGEDISLRGEPLEPANGSLEPTDGPARDGTLGVRPLTRVRAPRIQVILAIVLPLLAALYYLIARRPGR